MRSTSCPLNDTFVKMTGNVVDLKSNLTAAAADARRVARNTWYAAETFFDGVSYAIKREPFKAVGFTFGVALGVGAMAGGFARRK